MAKSHHGVTSSRHLYFHFGTKSISAIHNKNSYGFKHKSLARLNTFNNIVNFIHIRHTLNLSDHLHTNRRITFVKCFIMPNLQRIYTEQTIKLLKRISSKTFILPLWLEGIGGSGVESTLTQEWKPTEARLSTRL